MRDASWRDRELAAIPVGRIVQAGFELPRMHREDRNNVACSGVTRPNRIIMGVGSHREVDKLVRRGFLDPPEHLVGRLVAVDRIRVTAEVDVARHSGGHVIQRRGDEPPSWRMAIGRFPGRPRRAHYDGPMSGPSVPGGVVHELPADLRKALIANATALDAWKDITPLARNEFICWVEDAKQVSTRERRIRRTQEELEEGQRRPCCWPGCKHRDRTGR
jgi:hypothetical protein